MNDTEHNRRIAAQRHLATSWRRLKTELWDLMFDPTAMMGLVLIIAVVYAALRFI